MSIISKPHTFGLDTNPTLANLDADFDSLYNDYNGNITDPNVSATANIQQTKIQGLSAALAVRLVNTGDTMLGELKLKFSQPYIRWKGTEAGGQDWRLLESGGLFFQKNTGTEDIPVWQTLYNLDSGGSPTTPEGLATKAYVDAAGAGLAISKVTKTDADFSISSTSFTDVTGLSTNITTGARRVWVGLIATIVTDNSADANQAVVTLTIDSTNVVGTFGLVSIGNANIFRNENAGFSFMSDVLSAGAHTFTIQVKKTGGNNTTLKAGGGYTAILQVEELSR